MSGAAEPAVSIVVPTHDRIEVLGEVLDAIEGQETSSRFELVVVDDGSTDGTADLLSRRSWRIETTILRQENRGPAAARNAGVDAARGSIVAFLGDDTAPERSWLEHHLRRHRRERESGSRAVAVIGRTRWHPRMRTTPFLRYINEYGLQFGFSLIQDPDDVPFNFFYTSNLSLSRELLLAEPFDLAFPYPAWEDIEVSYRLSRRHGLRLVYEPAARVLHDHPTDLERFARRQWRAGYCAVVFYRRHPELGSFLGLGPEGPPSLPTRWRQRLREILARGLQRFPVKLARLWEDVLRYHYIAGLRQGWRDGAGLEPAPSPRDTATPAEDARVVQPAERSAQPRKETAP